MLLLIAVLCCCSGGSGSGGCGGSGSGAAPKADGLQRLQYAVDSLYDPGFLSAPEAEELYKALCGEACVDPVTGTVAEGKEMEARDVVFGDVGKTVSGTAIPSGDRSFLHPPLGRQTFHQYTPGGKWNVMPHRHSLFADKGVDISDRFARNSKINNVDALQPPFTFEHSPTMESIRRKLETYLKLPSGFLNFCNVNFYTTGDRLNPHPDGDDDGNPPQKTDGEWKMGEHIVRTVTLGSARSYCLFEPKPDGKKMLSIAVQPGSVNMLGHQTNVDYYHGIPATSSFLRPDSC